jgi:hypothetical protein
VTDTVSIRGAPLNVLVTGMHRSGTSAVGHTLAAAGVSLGPSHHHMTPTVENPDGYAELQPVADFNDRALATMGWTWDAPPAQPEIGRTFTRRIVEEGRRLLAQNFDASSWFVKDPRFALLLPLWRRILLDRFVVVFTWRPALEVAWSLAVRDGFSMTHGLALWSAYYRHLASGLSGLPAIAVDYVALTERPLETSRALFAALKQHDIGVDSDADEAALAVRPALRRATAPGEYVDISRVPTMEELLPGWPPGDVVAFDRFELVPAAATASETDILLEHRRWREAVTVAETKATETSRVGGERDQIAAERDQIAAERDQIAAERDHIAVARDQVAAERDERGQDRDRVIAELEQLRTEHAALAASLDESDRWRDERDALARDRDALAAERDLFAAQRDELAGQHDWLESERTRLTVELNVLRGEIETLRGEIEQLRRETELYAGSTSWRATAPMRAFGRAARRLMGRS